MWERYAAGLTTIAVSIAVAMRVVFRYDRIFVADAKADVLDGRAEVAALRAEIADLSRALGAERARCDRLSTDMASLRGQMFILKARLGLDPNADLTEGDQ